jgi:hypothetical protein
VGSSPTPLNGPIVSKALALHLPQNSKRPRNEFSASLTPLQSHLANFRKLEGTAAIVYEFESHITS